MASYSATRWWSKWEIFKQLLLQFGDIEPFLNRNTDLGPSSRPRLLAILSDQEKLKHLKLELAAVIDWGEIFVKATYNLEGDEPLSFTPYEEVRTVAEAVRIVVCLHSHLYNRDIEAMLETVCSQLLTTLKDCLTPP